MRYINKYKNIIEEKYNNYQEDERFNRNHKVLNLKPPCSILKNTSKKEVKF